MSARRDSGHGQPPVLHQSADFEQHQRRCGDLHARVGEDQGEARHHEVEQHEDRRDADQCQQSRINQRADDVAAQIVAGTLELGEALENLGQRSGGLSRADHVDVELGEIFWVRGQAVGERFAALEDAHDVEHQGAEIAALGELGGDGEGAVDGHAGVQQRREFLREEEDVLALAAVESGSLSSKPFFCSTPM